MPFALIVVCPTNRDRFPETLLFGQAINHHNTSATLDNGLLFGFDLEVDIFPSGARERDSQIGNYRLDQFSINRTSVCGFELRIRRWISIAKNGAFEDPRPLIQFFTPTKLKSIERTTMSSNNAHVLLFVSGFRLFCGILHEECQHTIACQF